MQAFHYINGGAVVMRSPRKSADEQYALIMECRSSGLSDQQWCMQHDINPGTFYNWVKRLRKKACYDIPAATGHDSLTAPVKQEVVKIDIVPDPDPATVQQNPTRTAEVPDAPMGLGLGNTAAPIEICFNEAVLRITNDVDPRLLSQILRNLGGTVC
jgi:transposase-like protein